MASFLPDALEHPESKHCGNKKLVLASSLISNMLAISAVQVDSAQVTNSTPFLFYYYYYIFKYYIIYNR